ncbi:hypothetical protein EUX98_g1724 [Antrodiella citrinella]|uniref:Transcription factor BYE1 n=1 Tax=Antrodiella citrinella TaxID=2447956 RepID=A0A4S4N0Q9_9APHY|nr:hypothetical protein EUX98_g1724 [Antrodiella citrinella]
MSTRRTRSKGGPSLPDKDIPQDKENSSLNGSGKVLASKSKPRSKARVPKSYCLCRKSDDRSPMILCSECGECCVDLKEEDAEEIHLYVCPPCSQQTGLHTVMNWEGPEASEKRTEGSKPAVRTSPRHSSAAPTETSEVHVEEEESSGDGSGDEYIAELAKSKGKGKRRTLRVSIAESDESSSDEDRKPKRVRRVSMSKESKQSKSPAPVSAAAKRKQSNASAPDSKRQRSMSTSGEDAIRKYCRTKLEEMFLEIFLRYPNLPAPVPVEGEEVKTKTQEDLTPEEKATAEENAKRYTEELEQSVFDLYAEPDKHGNPSPGGKYKERFRMLQFNLSKTDRVNIHAQIASAKLAPTELATMSSTDLANDEIKQSIKQAEEESLAHSILKKATLPRAKMTHKGMQDIEDVNGSTRERDRDREQEEDDDRMERERLARLKVQTQRSHSQNQGDSSVPPESPAVAQNPTWGGPPPLPSHATHPHDTSPSPTSARPPANPLFVPSASEMVTSPVEGELNLADLINIDDDPTSDMSLSISIPPDLTHRPSVDASLSAEGQTATTPASLSTTALSPFAEKPASDLASRASFDLSSLWTPKDDSSSSAPDQSAPMAEEYPSADDTGEPLNVDITMQEGDQPDDQDFDMFLDNNDDEPTTEPKNDSPEAQRAAFDALPVVWSGKISMPLDSTIPQEVSLMARQSGGRSIAGDSLLWQTLFPSDHLRIDGRVPTANSAQYLTHSRLNTAKELIAVAFSPDSEASKVLADALIQYLLGKGRHGLIFPWGNRPKEHHPGRELYIVPLRASDPLPDYMELIDDLQLPKSRTVDYLIGIWVLNKGKLVPPPNPPSAPITSSIPPTLSQTGVPPPSPAAPSYMPPPMPPTQPPQQEGAAANLANQVAALTPEQIQMMLRQLGTAPTGIPVLPPLIPPQMPPGPPPMPPHQSSWNNAHHPPYPGPPPPNAGYPPHIPPPQPHPPMSPPQPYPSGSAYDYDYDRSYDRNRAPPYPPRGGNGRGGGPDFGDRGDRGDRGGFRGGRGGPGGGGRGGRARGGDFNRPRDSGWKGRGRGRGGGPDASPTRDGGWWNQ